MAGRDNSVCGFLSGPLSAADVPSVYVADVQVWLILRHLCGTVIAGAHLDR